MRMENYLTEGNAAKSIAYFSIPLVLSSVFQQLYNLVDSIIVGNYVGEDALAAVGASYSITMVFMSIAIGSGIGCAVVISQYYGAKMIYKMKTSIYTSIIGVLYLGIFSTTIAFLLQTICQRDVSQTKSAIILSLESVFGTILSVIILHEVLTLKMIVGCLIIFCAIIISETKLSFLKKNNLKEEDTKSIN